MGRSRTILHISDTHAQRETTFRLNTLARLPECRYYDVVAVTGDCRSLGNTPGEDWNGWPQPWKFCVRGNEDRTDTYDRLTRWNEQHGPWGVDVGRLRFIGVDRDASSGIGLRQLRKQLEEMDGRSDIESVVLLSHYRPPFDEVVNGLDGLKRLRAVLGLHGHEHGKDTSVREIGSEWREEDSIGGVRVFRSNVYSAADRKRGCAHRIRWDGEAYSCEQVRVDITVTPCEQVRA
ncbi:MAG: hypothetical protein F4Z04_05010 [Acidobacteria bacterium]|nr:hypothetical protein [Acidobacteriota bacterium]